MCIRDRLDAQLAPEGDGPYVQAAAFLDAQPEEQGGSRRARLGADTGTGDNQVSHGRSLPARRNLPDGPRGAAPGRGGW